MTTRQDPLLALTLASRRAEIRRLARDLTGHSAGVNGKRPKVTVTVIDAGRNLCCPRCRGTDPAVIERHRRAMERLRESEDKDDGRPPGWRRADVDVALLDMYRRAEVRSPLEHAARRLQQWADEDADAN